MSQVKHSGDPAAEKPVSRRGAAGRAAALRRAPSDSDCSGETASLSADSGERRPPPPPPRGKTRNRRRGSEWEVLEGLKDGQRFERRPEVFNGFLHKKRKWPLKGWHKRFFVVDGGILVYARSPTDVARGRLHGSLDVGLSVISAKPRRRRIDIDADEFIYHLRAKTPDVFRTWLNVLKAHRLYRQHLLTFGARESVPKIHAPLDELPPTDTSSRVSQSSLESFSSLSQSQTDTNKSDLTLNELTSVYESKSQNTLSQCQTNESSLIPFEPCEFDNLEIYETKLNQCGSLCSAQCIDKRRENRHDSYKALPNIPLSIDEQQMHSTDLDLNTLNSYNTESKSTSELKNAKSNIQVKSILSKRFKRKKSVLRNETQQELNASDNIRSGNNENEKSTVWLDNKDHTALYFFSRKRRNRARFEEDWTMKRSRKCTNLVKYRNSKEEPCLTKPLLRHLVLCKYKRNIGNCYAEDKNVNCNLINDFVKKADKFTQDVMTPSEYDDICEKLVFNLFDDHDISSNGEGLGKTSIYVNLVVKELYDLKLHETRNNPIKMLFKSLLQYFLKHTEGKFKNSIKRDASTNKPSNPCFSCDKDTSCINSKYIQDSQDLEKLIESTMYSCSIFRRKSRETDIEITKTLLNNLDTLSSTFGNVNSEDIKEPRTESSELVLLQQYLKHILSDTSLPKVVVKDFLNAYLDLLGHRSRSAASTVSSESARKLITDPKTICQVQTERVEKKISKTVSACNNATCNGDNLDNPADQNQLNFRDILKKIMDMFTNDNVDEGLNADDISDADNINATDAMTSGVNNENHNPNDVVSGILDDNKIIIDLSKYKIENLSLSNNASAIGSKCITINLIDKVLRSNELKSKNSNMKFDDFSAKTLDEIKSVSISISSDFDNNMVYNNAFKDNESKNAKVPDDEVDIQTLSTPSGGTSKANLDITNNHIQGKVCNDVSPNRKEDTQCFFLSSIKQDEPNFLSNYQQLAQTCKRNDENNNDLFIRILRNLVVPEYTPDINTDINNLYIESKKACKKDNKDSAEISFLGKIYLNENLKSYDDAYVNSKSNTIKRNVQKKLFEIAVNTSIIFPGLKTVEDRALSAIIFADELTNIAVQTLSRHDEVKESHEEEKDDWFNKLTLEYLKNNAIKCMLKKYHLPQSIRIAHPIRAKIPERHPVTKRSSKTLRELSNLSPPLALSNRFDKKDKHREWNLVQFFKNDPKLMRSESVADSSVYDANNDVSDELRTVYRCTSEPSYCSGLISPNAGTIRGPQAGFVSGTPGGRLAGWIVESGGPLESASRELGQAQLSVQQLQRLMDAMLELQNLHHHDTDVSLEGASPSVKKDRRKFGLRKKKSNSKCASVELAPPLVDPSGSHMALSALTAPPSPGGGASSMPNSAASLPIACAAARPQSLPGAEALSVGAGPASLTSLTPDHQLREDFTILAKDLVANLKTVVSTLVVERGRLRAAMEASETPAAGGVVAALRTNLSSALQQNSELRSRLSRIHDASDLAEISSVGNNSDQQAPRPFPQSLSYSSSCVSASEFFDAEEHEDELKPAEIITTDEAGVIELDGDSSSEAGSLSSEEGSASSDNSDGATSAVIPPERTPLQNGSDAPTICTRRSRLPCPRPTPASPSLWNLLYKNIGKDLSQISMPVTINEPLNMLQRLCEELEYSELLDSAASCNNELERMSLIAAFAVSAYAASAHRAASKPFNPLLAETYEFVRGDRNFRFIAEQVSHHPPISACHAESPRWTFWQEARIKTKFWGKSMEFQPTGRVHVRLNPSGDHYSWNKVTTCVHNLFGGQRWVDQYGDMHIVCHGTDITCKLQFIKASSWSSSRHEVRGAVSVSGSPRLRLQGRWSEGLQAAERTLWRPGAMPPDYELYYGFTRFAMELNELEPGMRDVLPSTDTRLRPDQRALEEGDVDAAEQFKLELEQAQRERRRDGVEHTPLWFRKTVEDGEETWVFTGEYWAARDAGFARSSTPRLW